MLHGVILRTYCKADAVSSEKSPALLHAGDTPSFLFLFLFFFALQQ